MGVSCGIDGFPNLNGFAIAKGKCPGTSARNAENHKIPFGVNPHGLSPTTNDEKYSINAMAMVIS
jgi:hypothetical protein